MEVKPLSEKELKEKEKVLDLLYIREWITKTQYFETLERIRRESRK